MTAMADSMPLTDIERLYTPALSALAAGITRVGRLPHPDASIRRRSAVCGSSITVDVCFDAEGRVADYRHEPRACLFGQAAAAILARRVIGCDAGQLAQAAAALEALLAGTVPVTPPVWPELVDLAPVRALPARHEAVRLAFRALTQAFDGL